MKTIAQRIDETMADLTKPLFKSRLHAECGYCHRRMSRTETYVLRPGQRPSFTDRCPHCSSENIEVIDPVAEKAARQPPRTLGLNGHWHVPKVGVIAE